MADVTREEIDAKLEAVEARLETRLVSLDGKLDRLIADVQRGTEIGREAKEESRLAKEAASNIKWNFGLTILTAAIAVIAVIIAMWTISYQITDTVRASVTQPPVQTSPQSPQAPAAEKQQ